MASYPTVNRNQQGSITDAQIQGFIQDGAAFIRALFYGRGLDVANLGTPYLPSPTTTQVVLPESGQFLLQMNRAYATWKVGEILHGVLSDTEYALAKVNEQTWNDMIASSIAGLFDKIIWNMARTEDIGPGLVGSPGGTVPPLETPASVGYYCSFSKDMQF
jgi:hypothetical protein